MKNLFNKYGPKVAMGWLYTQFAILPIGMSFLIDDNLFIKGALLVSGCFYLAILLGADGPRYPIADASQAQAAKEAQDRHFNEPKSGSVRIEVK